MVISGISGIRDTSSSIDTSGYSGIIGGVDTNEYEEIAIEVNRRWDEEDAIATTLRLNKTLHGRIRVAAAYEQKSMAEWIREALELVVERVEAKRDA